MTNDYLEKIDINKSVITVFVKMEHRILLVSGNSWLIRGNYMFVKSPPRLFTSQGGIRLFMFNHLIRGPCAPPGALVCCPEITIV